MRITLFLILICLATTGFAQPKAVQIELNETFAQYQNAYNNATAAYNMLEKGYKKSASIIDAQYYLGSARKYAKNANGYCVKAANSSESTLAIASVAACDRSKEKYEQMKLAFEGAGEKYLLAQAELDKALEIEDFNLIAKYMADAIRYLQSGVLKLNLAVEEMNAGSGMMKHCK